MITAVARIMQPTRERREPPAETKRSNGGLHAGRNAYPTSARGVLSNEQKARLCIHARKAFAVVLGRDPATTAEMDEWRHAEVEKAVGKHGLTWCVQADYKPLEGHFLALAGESGRALQSHLDHATEPRRIAMNKLARECEARGLKLSYAAVICRSKFKCSLEEAKANQLWKLVFDIRTRKPTQKSESGKQERRKSEEPF